MGKKFEHEKFYDRLKEFVETDSDDLEVLLEPYLGMFRSAAHDLRKHMVYMPEFQQLKEKYPDQGIDVENWSWVELFPHLLPPHQTNYMQAAAYMIYRLYSTGNIIYSVSKHLTEAFYRTDFKIDFDQVHFPHNTFIIYWGGADHGVMINENGETEKRPILFQFVDVVDYKNGLLNLRQIYGYIDRDGDLANSGPATLTFEPENKVLDSQQMYETVWGQDYSMLSDMYVPEWSRYNNYVIYQLLWNFLLYVNNINDRVVYKPHEDFARLKKMSNPAKKRKLRKRLTEESPYRYTYIGASYDRRVEQVRSSSTGHKLTRETVVRGHWRNQWIGPRKDSAGRQIPGTHQKLIWIEPFVKGKGKDEPEKTLVYRVV